jgi:hypothetical protein
VLYLRAFATPEQTEAAVRALGSLRDVRHMLLIGGTLTLTF